MVRVPGIEWKRVLKLLQDDLPPHGTHKSTAKGGGVVKASDVTSPCLAYLLATDLSQPRSSRCIYKVCIQLTWR
jgi:hypothetical protein